LENPKGRDHYGYFGTDRMKPCPSHPPWNSVGEVKVVVVKEREKKKKSSPLVPI
jgi:hypothetical protein